MRMQKEIFESEVFLKLADEQLILVNADFPRKRKNQLSAGQQKINDGMADKYNPQGKFPYTLLLNSEGRVIKSWEGLPEESAEIFTVTIRNSIYTNQAEK